MPRSLKAFLVGAVAAPLIFLVLALLAELLGGNAWITPGGAGLLMILGGLFGLFVNFIYQRGRRDASRRQTRFRAPMEDR